jgi:hypothetical protein
MKRSECFASRLEGLGQAVVGKVLVGEERVATDRWNGEAEQAGRHRRGVEKTPVRMPALAEQRCLFIGVASDLGDVIAALDWNEPRVRAEATERLGEPFKFVVGHSLIGKHEHMVLVEGGAQFGSLGIIDCSGVEVGDDGAACVSGRSDDGHGRTVANCAAPGERATHGAAGVPQRA